MSYTAYTHERLKKTRGDQCCNCGSKDGVEYHHVIPLAFGGKDVLSNIYPVCSKCHSLIHFGERSVISHSDATKIGMEQARKKGRQIGRKSGCTVETKKAVRAKGIILAASKDFRGFMTDVQVINSIGNISRNSYYKYKKELKEQAKVYIKQEERDSN